MKIEQKAKDFQPITITLESYEEAATIKALVGAVLGIGPSRDICDKVYYSLDDKGIKSMNLASGTNRLKFAGE